jgi:hypothetical protein
MIFHLGRRHLTVCLVLVLAASHAGCSRVRGTPRPTVPPDVAAHRLAELWVEPADIPSLDIFHGPGGAALAPRPGSSFRFVEKDTTGFSAGWDVEDASGVRWSVKQGPEAQSEIVASRLLWALGYRQPPTYYLDSWRISDGPEPGPQQPGRFRPALAGGKREGPWKWEHNPFAGTQAFRGLLVLMRIINNWDLLDRNTTTYAFDPPRDGVPRWYVVIDLGAAFGKTHGLESRRSGTRNDIDDFERQGFLEGVSREGFVEFDQLGKWHRGLFGHLTPADLRWTCERLRRLSPDQWRDAFRAGGYDDDTARRFITALHKRIDAGMALEPAPAPVPGK